MVAPRAWEIVSSFKRECESRGWKVSWNEDWIKSGDEYHNFLWTRTFRPGTFKKITEEHKCAIKQGVDYQVIDVAYTAWLFSEPPPEELLETVEDHPELFKKTAIYDLSWMHPEKPICLKLNRTDSLVFKEFERFLAREFGVEFKPLNELLPKQV